MLRIDDLEVLQKDDPIFSVENFYLDAGEKAAVIGSNDSGKSLLLKAIHGEYTNIKGIIFVKEKSTFLYKKRKRTILIDHTPRILENESVWKNIVLPLPKMISRTKQKITQLCEIAGLDKQLNVPISEISSSKLRLLELIRATVQLPYLILVDDMDNYFDAVKLKTATEILSYATKNGSSVLVTSKQKLEDFNAYYRIQNKKLVSI